MQSDPPKYPQKDPQKDPPTGHDIPNPMAIGASFTAFDLPVLWPVLWPAPSAHIGTQTARTIAPYRCVVQSAIGRSLTFDALDLSPRIKRGLPDGARFQMTRLSSDDITSDLATQSAKGLIIFTFPKAGSSTCTQQAVDFSALAARMAQCGYRVFGLSPDPAHHLARFITTNPITIPLISDPDRMVLEPMGIIGPKMMYGKHVTGVNRFVITLDPNLRITNATRITRAKSSAADSLARLENNP